MKRNVALYGLLLLSLAVPSHSALAQSDVAETRRPDKFEKMTVPLRDIPDVGPDRPARGGRDFEPGRPFPLDTNRAVKDGALQTVYGPSGATIEPKAATNGVPVDQTNRVAPPDTTGDIGPNHYVQWVNLRLAIYTVTRDASNNITGFNLVGGFPKNGNVLFSALGGACASMNDGDPLVQYDQTTDRWILTQFAVSSTPYKQCVAVSQTGDPTGAYNLYSYDFGTDFNDFPKMGVWGDTYVITYNMFKRGRTFAGGQVCGYEKGKMLAGQSARQICVRNTSYASFLPADAEGSAAPAAGTAIPVLTMTSTSVLASRFSVNWAAGTASLTAPAAIPGVASFSRACGGGTCVPQPGTTNKLDSLGDRLNYRLSYRNFGTYEAMVVNHAITSGSSTGIRWYELRNATGQTLSSAAPVIYQQGTFAPDSSYRWMGSAAMDKTGGIAIGYNISNASTIAPSLRYAYRGPSDTPGTLGGETSILVGPGSQTGTLARWGDYSTISVDPDGCQMVFTTEYIPANGSFNWATYIYSFKLSTCQ